MIEGGGFRRRFSAHDCLHIGFRKIVQAHHLAVTLFLTVIFVSGQNNNPFEAIARDGDRFFKRLILIAPEVPLKLNGRDRYQLYDTSILYYAEFTEFTYRCHSISSSKGFEIQWYESLLGAPQRG